ncbi:hypothetical protein FQZ97_972980 [compost metagenome]
MLASVHRRAQAGLPRFRRQDQPGEDEPQRERDFSADRLDNGERAEVPGRPDGQLFAQPQYTDRRPRHREIDHPRTLAHHVCPRRDGRDFRKGEAQGPASKTDLHS